MFILSFLLLAANAFIFIYALIDLIRSLRWRKYQKLWDKEKAMLQRVYPRMTRPELCERYVMFCKRNDCMVDF